MKNLFAISLIVGVLLIGLYFTGIGFETKYYVTKHGDGVYGWVLKKGGFKYDSIFDYDTHEEASDAALRHRNDKLRGKVVKETLVDSNQK